MVNTRLITAGPDGCASEWMSAFANCGRAVAHVQGSYVPILFSIPGLGVKFSNDHPCRAHCSLRGRGEPSA